MAIVPADGTAIDEPPQADPQDAAPRPEPPAKGPEIVDVWSRIEPKYRVRAIVLLVLNLALFSGLCVFTYWLREARLFDFSWSSYFAPAVFWQEEGPSLNDFLTEPISIERTPAQAVVLGLLMGAIVSVPIVISILYRFGCSTPFVAAVLVFAHMPWMGMTLLLSCVLASVRPFRMRFRFASGLVALLPVVLYLALATGSDDQLAGASPTAKTLMAAPWVLAILAAAAMLAFTLILARLVNYRPGAVAPGVSLMFALPIVWFHVRVGVDELAYRVLENQYGPQSPVFHPVSDAKPMIRDLVQQIVRDDTLTQRYFPVVLAALNGEPPTDTRLLPSYFESEFMSDRHYAYEACRRFLVNHRNSRYVPCVLFIQAQVLDTRLDERKLLTRDPRRELYHDFPHVQSEPAWAELLNEHSDSPLAIAAALRLAQLRLRSGAIDEAMQLLEWAQTLSVERSVATQPAGGLLQAEAPEESLHFEPKPYRQEARRLAELIAANRNDPRYGDTPLVEFARLDPRRAGYREQLLRLADMHPGALLGDNLIVRYADALPTPAERETMLARLCGRLTEGDARVEAAFHLANLELQPLVEDETRRERGLARLRAITTDHSETCWAVLAADLLRAYEPRPLEPVPMSAEGT